MRYRDLGEVDGAAEAMNAEDAESKGQTRTRNRMYLKQFKPYGACCTLTYDRSGSHTRQ